jgi:hypothetical protein
MTYHRLAGPLKRGVRCLMRKTPVVFLALLIASAAGGASGSATLVPIRADEECANLFPADLAGSLGRTFAGAHVLTLGELDAEARAAFEKSEGHRCPGIAHVDFFGNKTEAYGILLITGSGQQTRAHLLLASRKGTSSPWKIRTLETGGGPSDLPFLGKTTPGEYEDVYGDKTIQAKGEALVWVQGNVVVIVYAWTGKDVDKVWLRD